VRAYDAFCELVRANGVKWGPGESVGVGWGEVAVKVGCCVLRSEREECVDLGDEGGEVFDEFEEM
jgi:hypothetical protein